MLSASSLTLIALLVLLPISIVHIRRTGPGPLRSAAIIALAVYMAVVVGVTQGPLPVDGTYPRGFDLTQANLIPFRTIGRYFADGVGLELASRQVGGNLVLLMPLGFLAPIVSERVRTLSRVMVLGVVVALAIESIQVLVILGLGNVARAVDVDDVILNTVGAMIGWAIWKGLSQVSPGLAPDRRVA
ncbi:MAG TPA: VanZ family protein [Acidimicrobiia bacterium]